MISLGRAVGIVSEGAIQISSITTLMSLLLVTISLVILFIHKLVQVYRNLNEREHNKETEFLMEPITKVTILSSISLFITLMNAFLWGIYNFSGNPRIIWNICVYISTLDLYSNFICVLFCEKAFKDKYFMICSCLDLKCRDCWRSIVVDKKNKVARNTSNITDEKKDNICSIHTNNDSDNNVDIQTQLQITTEQSTAL